VLDVEWAHAIAPGANILLVHTPTAETYGVQGLPQMIKAEDYIVKNHLADVISQSFGASEASFGSPNAAHAALLNQRYAFEDAKDAGVTVLASSGDFGSTNLNKQGITGKGADVLQFPNVGWPGSDPLVTGVGGTYLCQDPANTSTRTVDSTDPPSTCQAHPGTEEIGWIDSGGGFSSVFPRPSYQDVLPPGSTPIPAATRGVPDVAYNASARTGVLVYVSLPPVGGSGAICADGSPCSSGWYIIGGTSAGSPQWAGLVALADQIAGKSLGFINPALYAIANSSAYSSDFYDVTTGNNQIEPTVTGYDATPGWDPVTGLGTPNAANLLPDLAARAG
jgi:subtilase family serine protease